MLTITPPMLCMSMNLSDIGIAMVSVNSDLRNNSCRPYFIIIHMGRHYIHEYLTPSDSEGLNLMNIMPTHM